jgi:hypothetical protein
MRPERIATGSGKSSRRDHRHAEFFATPCSSAMSPRPRSSGARAIAAEASSPRRFRLRDAIESVVFVYTFPAQEEARRMKNNRHEEARAYYRLCDEARALGIATSLDDPRSPRTVAALERAVRQRRAARGREGA